MNCAVDGCHTPARFHGAFQQALCIRHEHELLQRGGYPLSTQSRPLAQQAIRSIQETIAQQTRKQLQALRSQVQSLQQQIQAVSLKTAARLNTLQTNSRFYTGKLEEILRHGLSREGSDRFLESFVQITGSTAVINEHALHKTLANYGYSQEPPPNVPLRQSSSIRTPSSSLVINQTCITRTARTLEAQGEYAQALGLAQQRLTLVTGREREKTHWHAATLALKAGKMEIAIQHFEECAKEAERNQNFQRAVESWLEVAGLVEPDNAASIEARVQGLLAKESSSQELAEDADLNEAIKRSLRF